MLTLEQKITRIILGLSTVLITDCGPERTKNNSLAGGDSTNYPPFGFSQGNDTAPNREKDATANYSENIIPEEDSLDNCAEPYYEDKDGDGYGDYKAWTCEPLEGYINNDFDCNDYDAKIYKSIKCNYDGIQCGTFDVCANQCVVTPPENPCNYKDDNCNNQIDENKNKQYTKTCSEKNLYWQDECGDLGAVIKTCNNNEICINEVCEIACEWVEEGICAKGYECCEHTKDCCPTPCCYGYCLPEGSYCPQGGIDNLSLCNTDDTYPLDKVYLWGYCENNDVCKPWCDFPPGQQNEQLCCPQNKKFLTGYQPVVGNFVQLCCDTCYGNATTRPSNCVNADWVIEFVESD